MRPIIFACLACLLSYTAAVADPLTQDEMLSDLNQLVASLKANYGPLAFKKSLGIDIDQLAVQYRDQLPTIANNSDFYYFIARFIAEFKDSHFSVNIPSTHASKLGFEVDLVNDKVLIDSIDRTILTEAQFPFSRGDELVSRSRLM